MNPHYAVFPAFQKAHTVCPVCQGHVEVVGSMPTIQPEHYVACCFNCPSSWEKGATVQEAMMNFTNGKKVGEVIPVE